MQKGKTVTVLLLALLMLTGTQLGYSQVPNALAEVQGKKYPLQQVRKVGSINLTDAPDDPWQPMMYNTQKVHIQGDRDHEQYLKAKAAANAMKEELRGQVPSSQSSNKIMSDPPIQGVNFFGNTQDGIPNDNAIAVSKDGFIISATNSKVQIYDETGQALLTRSLAAFFNCVRHQI